MSRPFWETKQLSELTREEWESLCDGCGKCCLLKLEDEDTGEVAYTRLHCRLFDPETCSCSDYENRKEKVPDCIILTPQSVSDLKWMPKSCAYRRINEGRGLADWHHLVCGDRNRIHEKGHSVLGRTVSEDSVLEEDQINWIIDWEGNPPD
ncbi:YcgN family cysteine cluster protein [Henriciella mobilis]|uniref:YcgN family cysteine cluster protein n=1 Tax=Henriciella mobilis TaxID=2305467 RepID=UPI000E66EEF5|nr:YcgN family cysteine cluster protein [Henriciella mobilis]RIJ18210.1 YcgN family cysteine cluster protein [Henriciella mobilis]RIJ24983.1 YcgN family cysteine cluster protein [Henriciella mobilis]